MYDVYLVTGATGVSELKVLLAMFEGSEGCKVEIRSMGLVKGLVIEIEVFVVVCITGIKGAHELRDLESLCVAWYDLSWYAKVVESIMLEN